jgi:hypothetical protein
MSLYDRDFHAWANEQAALARSRSANALDWDNVAEELEDLGASVRNELRSRYVVLLKHLLKWRFQPGKRSSSWEITIGNQRDAIVDHIDRHPSLKAEDAELFAGAYGLARKSAGRETGMGVDAFPTEPPFTPEEAREEDFWPEPSEVG